MVKRVYKKRVTRKYVKPVSGGGAMATAMKALKVAERIKNLVNVETKEFTQTLITAQYTNTGANAAFGLCYPGQGLGNGMRIGDSIKVHNFKIKGVVNLGAAATSQVRILIFKGKAEDNKTYTVGGDMLELGTAGPYQYIFSPKKVDEYFNTSILWDKTFTLDSANHQIIPFSHHIKLGWHTKFIKGTNTFMDGGLYFCAVSNQTVLANAPLITFTTETTYTDD